MAASLSSVSMPAAARGSVACHARRSHAPPSAGVPKGASLPARRGGFSPPSVGEPALERNSRLVANLIMPGGNERGSQPQTGGQTQRLILDDDKNVTGNSYFQPFRPPSEFQKTVDSGLTTEEMLDRVSNRIGLWWEVAPLIPRLLQCGFTAPMLDEVCGLTPLEQNTWVIASNVRASLEEARGFDFSKVDYFDIGGEDVLYALRTLNGPTRADAANYIMEKNLGKDEAEELARSLKLHERKRGDKVGFTYHPGDAMAFNLHRLAGESKNPTTIRQTIDRAMEYAVTDEAREELQKRLRELLGDGDEEEEGEVFKAPAATVPSVRLLPSEGAFRPICVAGKLGETTLMGMGAAPKTVCEGAFNMFSTPAGTTWTAVPDFVVLGNYEDLVAVSCDNATAEATLAEGAKPGEPCLVVVDRSVKAVENDGFYFACESMDAAPAKVVAGAEVGERAVAGKVVLVVRPALAEAEDATQWTEEEDVDRQAAAAGWL
eukprot:CAMPEP_0182884384 /NCGR_PEP_ID=MMETSP0034_2-20130328/18955_1 /TAXON_ID=156128 /ORGANISM="Nephroselmis pyriformis, Strain CCMP717" /LENGTH=489 /DNA_ID=CAMNT_0025017573 /DNA_START=25 /DNA_END=1494 /DNA_ORIENTATION=+